MAQGGDREAKLAAAAIDIARVSSGSNWLRRHDGRWRPRRLAAGRQRHLPGRSFVGRRRAGSLLASGVRRTAMRPPGSGWTAARRENQATALPWNG